MVEVLCEDKVNPQGYKAGTGNGDENMNASAAGRLFFNWHTEEGNAQYSGTWHLDRREWVQLAPLHVDQLLYQQHPGWRRQPAGHRRRDDLSYELEQSERPHRQPSQVKEITPMNTSILIAARS